MKVNLLKERNKAYSVNWMEISVVLLVVLLIAGVGIHYFTLYNQKSLLDTEVENLNTRALSLKIKVAEYNRLKAKVEELTRIKEKMDTLKYDWDRAIIEQGYVVPGQVMLKDLTLDGSNLTLQGRAANNQRILDLIEYMKLSSVYEDVSLQDLQTEDSDIVFTIDALIAEEGDQDAE
ncbi:MAG: PilN domain-containing protein [Halanaerobiales bacterium]